MPTGRPGAFPATRLWAGTGTWGNADWRRSYRRCVRARIGRTSPDGRPVRRYGKFRWRVVRASAQATEMRRARYEIGRHAHAQHRRLRVSVAQRSWRPTLEDQLWDRATDPEGSLWRTRCC